MALGQLEQLSLSLGAVSVNAASAELRFHGTPGRSEVTAELGSVQLGPLGFVPNVQLFLRLKLTQPFFFELP